MHVVNIGEQLKPINIHGRQILLGKRQQFTLGDQLRMNKRAMGNRRRGLVGCRTKLLATERSVTEDDRLLQVGAEASAANAI
jgi:hypothetical protein